MINSTSAEVSKPANADPTPTKQATETAEAAPVMCFTCGAEAFEPCIARNRYPALPDTPAHYPHTPRLTLARTCDVGTARRHAGQGRPLR